MPRCDSLHDISRFGGSVVAFGNDQQLVEAVALPKRRRRTDAVGQVELQRHADAGRIDLAAKHAGHGLTTITMVIRPPTSAETRWDWTIETENVSGGSMTSKVWAAEWVFSYIEDDVTKTLDSENTRADGDWGDQNPKSYMRWTVGSNTLGLTQGREFIIDYQDGLSGESNGGTITSGAWAGFDYGQYAAAFSYSGTDLPDTQARTNAGQLIIDGSGVAYQGGTSEYNIYTSLMWTQTSGSLETGEPEATPAVKIPRISSSLMNRLGSLSHCHAGKRVGGRILWAPEAVWPRPGRLRRSGDSPENSTAGQGFDVGPRVCAGLSQEGQTRASCSDRPGRRPRSGCSGSRTRLHQGHRGREVQGALHPLSSGPWSRPGARSAERPRLRGRRSAKFAGSRGD